MSLCELTFMAILESLSYPGASAKIEMPIEKAISMQRDINVNEKNYAAFVKDGMLVIVRFK